MRKIPTNLDFDKVIVSQDVQGHAYSIGKLLDYIYFHVNLRKDRSVARFLTKFLWRQFLQFLRSTIFVQGMGQTY